MKKIIALALTVFIYFNSLQAQQAGGQSYFSISSPTDNNAKDYGVINLSAGTHTTIIETIIAYGENVKDLSITMNNGFVFKLAPAQAGMNLNYVGNSMNIVLKPGEKAVISFTTRPKTASVKQLYVSGKEIN